MAGARSTGELAVDRWRALAAGTRRRSQSRLSRSRLDPAWSLQECRWAPYVRGHDPGQGQLPCESYRPPGQLLETHPAALRGDTYVLFAKNQSTSRAPGDKDPKRQRDCAKSGFCTAVAKLLRHASRAQLSGTSGRFDRHPRDAEPSDRRAGLVGSLGRRQGSIPVCSDETLGVHRLGLIGQQPKERRHHDGGP